MDRHGVLFIGSLGYIASAAMAGSLAMGKGLSTRAGMVTELKEFTGLGLIDPGTLVFGGWDIRRSTPLESARALFRDSARGCGILAGIEKELDAISEDIFPGVTTNCGRAIEALSDFTMREPSLEGQIRRIRSDIRLFREKWGLKTVTVCNVASTEPPLGLNDRHKSISGIEAAISEDMAPEVRASTLYAYAAVMEGCPYINFTPSNGALIPAIIELARMKGVPVMGNDGKTGETLVKSALIPLFLYRNLEVLSWEGFNILGNMDGRVLDDPRNKESKILTKDGILGKALGYSPHSSVHINYVPSLDDQKTAWNFIHFSGFLGAKMALQFIWQGYDSILAAPLLLDLVRLSELSKRRGESGLMTHLAFFFKAPAGVEEHLLHNQFSMLIGHIRAEDPVSPRPAHAQTP